MAQERLIQPLNKNKKNGTCLSCGESGMRPRRRYCSKECRQHMLWVLSLSKGLLRIFNARYASFSFNKSHVILDILPVWSKDISRFIEKRTRGNKPADDLKNLILRSGREWYHIIERKNSKSYASLYLLQRSSNKRISPASIKPDNKRRPRFSKNEKESIKLLKLELEELISEGNRSKIKSAYKNLAKIHHPDKGGDAEKFKRINEAHQQMLLWVQNPQFTSRKALIDCWSFDATTNRWAPPL
jgi:hypothetical protein